MPRASAWPGSGIKVLILEKHTVAGGLNSYYRRKGRLFETGLHAMTNFAPPGDKKAPLNRLFRQLKLSRKSFQTRQQLQSSILFADNFSLSFSNDPALLEAEIDRLFPAAIDNYRKLVALVGRHDPFQPRPFVSARQRLNELLGEAKLVDMLLLPLMMYGNSMEHDMDFDQFVIMFNAIFLEGFFRPAGTIKNFLDLLLGQYETNGGEIRFKADVQRLLVSREKATGVILASGEEIYGKQVISTAGYPATLKFMNNNAPTAEIERYTGRLSFVETIYLLPAEWKSTRGRDDTIIFYNLEEPFDYRRPDEAVNVDLGVICFPDHFEGLQATDLRQMRVTHPANYDVWRGYSPERYRREKEHWTSRSSRIISELVGNFSEKILFRDAFTPVTIKKYSGKEAGAVYGSPVKIKDGRTPLRNLFIAGTDQGYLGIVGAMLSGVTMVNNHILGKTD